MFSLLSLYLPVTETTDLLDIEYRELNSSMLTDSIGSRLVFLRVGRMKTACLFFFLSAWLAMYLIISFPVCNAICFSLYLYVRLSWGSRSAFQLLRSTFLKNIFSILLFSSIVAILVCPRLIVTISFAELSDSQIYDSNISGLFAINVSHKPAPALWLR